MIEGPTLHIYILGMFWRTVRLYEGALLLIEKHLPEEAAIIARSLFEDSLRLRELATDSRRRNALILGWANTSISKNEDLIKVAKSLGFEPNPEPVLASLKEQRSKLQRYVERHGVGKLKSFLDVRDAAIKFGRQDDYWTYAWSHQSVHGNDAAWLFARRKVTSDTMKFFGKTAEPRILVGFTAFAAVSLADGAQATASIFDWKLPVAVNELSKEIQRAADAYVDKK